MAFIELSSIQFYQKLTIDFSGFQTGFTTLNFPLKICAEVMKIKLYESNVGRWE